MRRFRKPHNTGVSTLSLVIVVLLHPVLTYSPRPATAPPALLRRLLRAPAPDPLAAGNSITFRKPRPATPPPPSALELAIDSTFGFVASKEASEVACQRIPGLSNHQRNLCRDNPGLIFALVDGTQLGLYECVHQFREERWNCSLGGMMLGKSPDGKFLLHTNQSLATHLIGGLQKTLKKGTRETAFLTAALAAGAVQAVTRACSRGRISTCDCDVDRRGGSKATDSGGTFTWGGCSDPIRFGMRLVRLFQEIRIPKDRMPYRLPQSSSLGNPDTDSGLSDDVEARILVDAHNQRVGRMFVWQMREKKCKCHGVSGACSLRTCWERVGAFRGVGDLLKKAYVNALQVFFDPSARQLRREPEPLNFGGLPLPVGHLSKRSTKWFVMGLAGPGRSAAWQRRRRQTQFGEKWLRRQKDKLAFLDHSSDYCAVDLRIGHLGVAGRQCDVDAPNSSNSCEKICCGRGYDSQEVDTKEKCGCKFVWCCEVKCNICHRKTRIHRCRAEEAAFSRRIGELINPISGGARRSQRRGSSMEF